MRTQKSKGLVMNEETVKLMNKNVNDLTVGDALKINGAILAVMVAIPLTITGVAAGKEKVASMLKQRKLNKQNENAKK